MRGNFETNLDTNVRAKSYADFFDVLLKLSRALHKNLDAIILRTVRRKLGSRCPGSSLFRKLPRELSRNLPRSPPRNLPPKLLRIRPCKLLHLLLRRLLRKFPCTFPCRIPQEPFAEIANCASTQTFAGAYTRFYTHTSPRTPPLIPARPAANIWCGLRREQRRKLLTELCDNCFEM